jgi:hypothetical protein
MLTPTNVQKLHVLAFLITQASKQKCVTQTCFDIHALYFSFSVRLMQMAAEITEPPVMLIGRYTKTVPFKILINSPYLTLLETDILNVLKCCGSRTRIFLTKTAILCQLVTIIFQSEKRKADP